MAWRGGSATLLCMRPAAVGEFNLYKEEIAAKLQQETALKRTVMVRSGESEVRELQL